MYMYIYIYIYAYILYMWWCGVLWEVVWSSLAVGLEGCLSGGLEWFVVVG